MKVIMPEGGRMPVDLVRQTFDKWAQNGRAELMESEHGTNVSRFLDSISFGNGFTFLDVGCGNGWVVRKMAGNPSCKKATGIDKSKKMIMQAEGKKIGKEEYLCADIESWDYRGRFDYVFAMESIYYAGSVETALGRIYRLLKPGGRFFCGTDFYSDNAATARWSKMMNLEMHLYSKIQWKKLFRDAGFCARTRHVKDAKSTKKWKREFGTLFITGVKPGGPR